MKKISLKDIKESMSRSEMKTIMAGSSSGGQNYGCGQPCGAVTCAFTPNCPHCTFVGGFGNICITN